MDLRMIFFVILLCMTNAAWLIVVILTVVFLEAIIKFTNSKLINFSFIVV